MPGSPSSSLRTRCAGVRQGEQSWVAGSQCRSRPPPTTYLHTGRLALGPFLSRLTGYLMNCWNVGVVVMPGPAGSGCCRMAGPCWRATSVSGSSTRSWQAEMRRSSGWRTCSAIGGEANPVFSSHHNEGEAVIGEEGCEGNPKPVLNAVVAPRFVRLR